MEVFLHPCLCVDKCLESHFELVLMFLHPAMGGYVIKGLLGSFLPLRSKVRVGDEKHWISQENLHPCAAISTKPRLERDLSVLLHAPPFMSVCRITVKPYTQSLSKVLVICWSGESSCLSVDGNIARLSNIKSLLFRCANLHVRNGFLRTVYANDSCGREMCE